MQPPSPPLALDFDGTLVRTDLLFEKLLRFMKQQPLSAWLALVWIVQGRAVLKRKLAERVKLNVETLPVREDVVAYARAHAERGRVVVVATASDVETAREAVAHIAPFAREVIGSDGRTNLKSRAKAKALAARFPEGFVYAGDSRADIKVWREAQGAVCVGRSPSLTRIAEQTTQLETAIPDRRPSLDTWIRAFRVHQWTKNLLVFAPLLLSGHAGDLRAWLVSAVGFFGLGLAASATYILNDLMDLDDDRAHWTKRHRPFASGDLTIASGLIVAPLALAAGFAMVVSTLNWAALAILCVYLVTSLAYSLRIKRVPILDATVLGALFTLRLALGAALVYVPPSPWLFVFSMVLFTSLSFAKRATEIMRLAARGLQSAPGRGYRAGDANVVISLGVSLGMIALLVMVLFLIQEVERRDFYGSPEFLWLTPPLLGLWLGRIWLLLSRGELDDDPVAFAIRDRVSIVLGAGMLAAFCAALLV
ncbi:MAG: UbiA family prenyltransferase [Alphaproteobacteria bacterium]|nr:UbiA family prenyltransferase [Alphaproteobacteria bacterium]